MKPEIDAATEFLSRIFLAHDNISKEKVEEFKQHLSLLLEIRYQDHWHESCPTKGQAYRCIRVCPEEPLDPILEKVCSEVGISVRDFNLPFELTLWVDPTEVVCKFGDLKCSYHIVAKKDHTSGNLDNQTDSLDIGDLVENARDLYLKKHTVVIQPIHSSEMHIQNPYPNGFTMAIRINGNVHYNLSGSSPPSSCNGSPRGKGKPSLAMHKRAGGYYGKSPGKGSYNVNGLTNGGSSNGTMAHLSFQHHHNHRQSSSIGHSPISAYSNGYLNGYAEDSGYAVDRRSSSPPTMTSAGSGTRSGSVSRAGQDSCSSPSPEQIKQQVQHPPPLPPHLQQALSHPSTTAGSLHPTSRPPTSSMASFSTNSTSSVTNINSHSVSGKISSNSGSGKTNNNSSSSGKTNNMGSSLKHQSIRRNVSSKTKQPNTAKDPK